jgi:hypothetical protein
MAKKSVGVTGVFLRNDVAIIFASVFGIVFIHKYGRAGLFLLTLFTDDVNQV